MSRTRGSVFSFAISNMHWAGSGGAVSRPLANRPSDPLVGLVPSHERTRSAQQLADAFRQELRQGIGDVTVRTSLPNAFGFGGFGGQGIQIQVEGSDPAVLNSLVDQITSVVQSSPGAVDVNNELQNVTPEYTVVVDPSRSADLGVTTQFGSDNATLDRY